MIWLRVLAAFLFAIALLVAWGSMTFTHDAVLIPGGLLAAWVLSDLPTTSSGYWGRRNP
jgi:hypothetical protein